MKTFLVGWLAFEIARRADDASLKAVTAEVIRNARAGLRSDVRPLEEGPARVGAWAMSAATEPLMRKPNC